MAVTIDLELQAGDVATEITGIATALETLEAAAGDVDLDFDGLDVDEISGEIGNMVDMLENLDLDLSSLEEDITRLEKLQNGGIDVNFDGPDGSTGSGDSTGSDPPGERPQRITVKGGDLPDFSEATADGGSSGSGLNKQQLANKIEKVGGFDRGSVNVLGDFDPEQLNKIASKIEHTTQDLTSGEYPHVSGIGDGNLGSSQMPGNFADSEDPSEMDWNKLQQRASEAGVYTQDADRAELENRLGSQQFGGKAITVETESHGTVGLRQAKRIKQGSYDFPTPKEINTPDFDKGGAMRFARDKDKIPDTDLRVASRTTPFTKGKKTLDSADELSDAFSGIRGKLRKLKPTMGKYMQLLAGLLPMAVALGTQLLGVAAAMGSVAAAGGAIMGLGLLGHGESLAGSMAEAKQQVRSLKQEMFQMAQPTMQQFAPIQARMFDSMPEGLEGVFEEMEGFTQYEDTLFELGGALAGGMEEAVAIINENEQAISQLTTRFGGLIGAGLLDFFEWLIQSADKNQQLILDLGAALISLVKIGFNLSMVLSRIIAAFRPLIQVIAWMSGFLNNKFVVGLLVAITTFGVLIFTTWKLTAALYAALGALASFGSGGIISGIAGGIAFLVGKIWGLITSLWSAVFASQALIATLSALTLGAFAIGAIGAGAYAMDQMDSRGRNGGGMGGSGMGGGGGTTVYNDNRSYEINNGGGDDYASQKAMEDTVTRVNETNDAQSLPDVQTSSESSDTPPEEN